MAKVRTPGGTIVDGWPFAVDRELPYETTADEATIRAIVAPGLAYRARRAGELAPPATWADAAIACARLRPVQVARLVVGPSARKRFQKLATIGRRIEAWGLVSVARTCSSENELARAFGVSSRELALARLLGVVNRAA